MTPPLAELQASFEASPLRAPARVPADWPWRAFSLAVPVGRLTWHVQVAGQGPVVLLLHGTGASAHSWADLLPELMSESTVVAVDLPGHGFTTGAEASVEADSMTLPRIAHDLDALLGALKLPPPHIVVGHSAGAALAVRWALNTARPPRALVGFNPSLVPPPAVYTHVLGPLLTPLMTSSPVASMISGLSARTGLIGRLLNSTQSRLTPAQRARYATLFSMPEHVRGSMGLMAVADLPAILRQGPGLRVPCTFVFGQQDEWVPERSSRPVIQRAFAAATLLSWPGGHLLHEAEPRKAAALVLDVLRATSSADPAASAHAA